MSPQPPVNLRLELGDGTIIEPTALTYNGQRSDGTALWLARFPAHVLDHAEQFHAYMDELPAHTSVSIQFEDLTHE
jgi:hypothetical protein